MSFIRDVSKSVGNFFVLGRYNTDAELQKKVIEHVKNCQFTMPVTPKNYKQLMRSMPMPKAGHPGFAGFSDKKQQEKYMEKLNNMINDHAVAGTTGPMGPDGEMGPDGAMVQKEQYGYWYRSLKSRDLIQYEGSDNLHRVNHIVRHMSAPGQPERFTVYFTDNTYITYDDWMDHERYLVPFKIIKSAPLARYEKNLDAVKGDAK